MSATPMGQEAEKPAGIQVGQPMGANGISTAHQHKPAYGDDVRWPNVVWITIGILCVCGLAALLFSF